MDQVLERTISRGVKALTKVTLYHDDNTWEAIATMIDLGWD